MVEVLEVEIDKIESNPYQPRRVFDEEKIRELAASIEKVGLLNPVLLRMKSESYQLIHGERRLRAFKLLQRNRIPSTIREISDREMAVYSLIENLQREDLNPIDEALCYKRMVEELEFTHEEIANIIDKARTHVTNRLRLLKLPEPIQEKVRRLTLTPGHAEVLLKYQKLLNEAKNGPLYPSHPPEVHVKKPEARLKSIATNIEKGNISVKHLRSEIRNFETKLEWSKRRREGIVTAIEEAENDGFKKYTEALLKEELGYANGHLILPSTKKEFTGQETRFPKYSGQEEIYVGSQEEAKKYPVFSETEWREISEYAGNHDEILHNAFSDFSIIEDHPKVKENNSSRRVYDPNYGDFFYNWEDPRNKERLSYVKKGWGRWVVVEFNDGEGDRTRRRFFSQDWLGPTLVEQAIQTAHPDMFSDFNYRELGVHRLQKYEMSWSYFRKKTATRKDAIEAFKKDLELLENQRPLTKDEIMEKAKEILNEVHEQGAKNLRFNHPDAFREGEITMKQEVE